MTKLKTPEEIIGRAEILSDDITKWSEQEIKLMIVAAQRDGANYEHPIAFNQGKIEGFNEGIEAAKLSDQFIADNCLYKEGDDYYNNTIVEGIEWYKKELEKLKK